MDSETNKEKLKEELAKNLEEISVLKETNSSLKAQLAESGSHYDLVSELQLAIMMKKTSYL